MNFKKLIDLALNDPYPLPHIEGCLDDLAGNQWFSSLDLQTGYWHIPIKEEDQEKTGFARMMAFSVFKFARLGLSAP